MMEKSYTKTILLTFFLCWGIHSATDAQNLEAIKVPDKKDLFGISGNLNIGAFLSSSNRSSGIATPFGYHLSGNINLKFSKINVPINLSFTDNRFSSSYNIPTFQRVGMSPYYKWVKVHAGWRNMNFSKYTLNGASFLGGGIELSPKAFRFSAMVGKLDQGWNRFDLQNAIPIEEEIILPQRMAYAVSVGFEKNSNQFKVIFFGSRDRNKNTVLEDLQTYNITSGSNFSLGTKWKFRLSKQLTFEGDWATSTVTTNNDSALPGNESGKFIMNLSDAFIPINRSTQSFFAGESKLNLRVKAMRVGFKFQHVDPFFTTYGLQFIRNDFQNYTGNLGFGLLKNKVNINLSYGYQRNNLENLKERTSTRKIFSGNVNAQILKPWNLSASYSNFTSDQKAALLEVNDTFRIANVNKNFNLVQRFQLKSKNKQSISLNFSKNQFTSLTTTLADSENSSNTVSLSHRIKFKEKHLQIKTALTTSNNNFQDRSTKRFGGNISVSKLLLEEKLSTSLRLRYQRSLFEDQQDGYVINFGLNLRYKISPKQSLSFNNNLLNRRARVQNSLKSWRGNLSYSLSF